MNRKGDVLMEIEAAGKELLEILDREDVIFGEMMKEHTHFKLGGPADLFINIRSMGILSEVLGVLKKRCIPFFLLGKGTNLIVRDGGYRGAVINLLPIDRITVEGNILRAGSGALLSSAAQEALAKCLKGMEFASGIPGSVGGAVAMNAGAYGPEIKDIIKSALLMDSSGNIFTLDREGLEFDYRSSIVQREEYIVIEAEFELENGEYKEIKDRMDELNKRRRDKQPLEYPSAGSTFKRPEGYYASKLIEDAGLKGLAVGGAMVSKKHSGFIINYSEATASDVLELIKQVQKKVKDLYGVELNTEVRIIGED